MRGGTGAWTVEWQRFRRELMKAVIRAAVGTTSGVDPHRRKREADLKSLASRFRNGDKTAPSQAIQLCMKDEIPSEEWPEWIKEGFLKYGPSGGKLKYQPAWCRKDCFEIWWCVQELRREAPQSSDVFGLVAKEFNTSPAMVKRQGHSVLVMGCQGPAASRG